MTTPATEKRPAKGLSVVVLGAIEFEGVSLDRALAALGHQVLAVESPDQAYDGLRRRRGAVDLLIVDLRDPVMSGLDVLAWLRSKNLLEGVELWAVAEADGVPEQAVQRQYGFTRVLFGDLSVEELAFGVRKLARVLAGDRRDEVRVDVRAKVILGGFGRPVRGELLNLSRGGAFVRASRVFAPGKRVSLSIELEEGLERLVLKGRVVRAQLEAERIWGVDLEPGMGIELTESDDGARARLEEYLRGHDSA